MATAKTTTLTFRIEPGLKEALRTAADREHRSIAEKHSGSSPLTGAALSLIYRADRGA